MENAQTNNKLVEIETPNFNVAYSMECSNSSSSVLSVVAAAAASVIVIIIVLVVIAVAVNLSCSVHHRQHHFNCSRYDCCSFSVLFVSIVCMCVFLYFIGIIYTFVHITHSINQFCPILEFMICSIQLNFIGISNNAVRNPANHGAQVIETEMRIVCMMCIF